jgi:hypothetical protein
MDHLAVLREKVASLRAEIAQLQELNSLYRRATSSERNGPEAQLGHGRRLERLQEIQKELGQLAGLSQRVLSIEERKEEHRTRLQPKEVT